MDDLDVQLLEVLAEATRPSVLDVSRALGVARNTAQARLRRLQDSGMVKEFGPLLDRRRLGLEVLAFVSLQVSQGHEAPLLAGLDRLPEVLEVHKTTGAADLLVKVVARDQDHLHDILQWILGLTGVIRSNSALALDSPVERDLAAALRMGLLRDGKAAS
jgi:DNA-binding Lrp family transcriptional regulator